MDEDNNFQQNVEEFHRIYEQMLSDERWQQSNYLKIIHARLKKLSDDLAESAHITMKNNEANQADENQDLDRALKEQTMQLAYIHLYTSEGKSHEAWERAISYLHQQFVSRSIYSNESYAQSAAQAAPIFLNAGYVAVWVEKSLIFPVEAGHEPKDKLGNPVILLKDRAIQLKNIEFFWNNYTHYTWKDQKLCFSKHVQKILL